MSSSSVLTDESQLSRLDQALLKVESVLNLLSGMVIFALVVLACYNVIGRKLFNAPVPGYVDWTEQFMATFAFLGLAYCQREGGHIRMDIVLGQLRGRVLWAAEWLGVVFMLLLTTALIYGTWFHFERSFDWAAPNWSTDSSIDIALPLWPAKLVVPLSLMILWLRLALQIWSYGRAFRRNDRHPIGVPLIEDAATQASREAETVEGSRTDG